MEVDESFKWSLMGYPSRNMKIFVAKTDVNYADLTQKVLVENFCIWYRDCLCDNLVKNNGFCHCLNSLPEDKVQINCFKKGSLKTA